MVEKLRKEEEEMEKVLSKAQEDSFEALVFHQQYDSDR